MQVTTIATPGLGDRSYVIAHEGLAIVIDPQRDIDRITDHLAEHSLQLGLVCETHIHNDYVTGGLALARTTGADYAVNGEDAVSFDRRPVGERDVIDIGGMRVTVLAAPGHTPTHLAYLVDGGSAEGMIFTGGSMLYATVGRTDLIGVDATEHLTRAQYRSVRRLAQSLPTATEVFPTHGFGSFCASAGGGSRTAGTIADELAENLACTTEDEDAFVATLRGGFAAYPPYYAHMGQLNRAGPLAPDLGRPTHASPADLAATVERGEWVVDLRPPRDFAAGHLAGSVSIDVVGAFATYLGWAIPWGTPVTLVADENDQVALAQREMVRIGIDRPMAMAVGGPDVFAKDQPLHDYPARTFRDLAAHPDATVVDVRRHDEWDGGHIDGAIHITLDAVAADPSSLPDSETLWVHCGSGFRAAIAASLIARSGRDVVHLDDDWDNARDSGRPIRVEG